MAREIRGWNIGQIVTQAEMNLNTANIMEEVGCVGEANLPCIYNGLTLQSQTGSGNSIITFNAGEARCQDLPTSVYTYLPPNPYGPSYACFIDIESGGANVITLTTTPSPGYIVATFTISPTSAGAVNYVITGSLLQISTGSYNPAIHVKLCQYTYTGSTFVLDFTPKTNRDTDFTGVGGIQWNNQNSSLVIDVPASQSGSSIILNQPTTLASTLTVSGNEVIQSGSQLQFNNSGNTFYTGLTAGANTSNTVFKLPLIDGTPNQAMVTNGSLQLSFASVSNTGNVAANDSNVVFTAASSPTQFCTPTAARTYTLPTTSISAGYIMTFYNTSNFLITIQSSGIATVDYVLPKGYLQLYANVATPTSAANWTVIEGHSSVISYTPTFGTGWGTTSNALFNYSRRGKFMTINGFFTTGTIISGPPSITLGGGFSIDTTYINSNQSAWIFGLYNRLLAGSSTGIYSVSGVWTYDGTNTNLIRFTSGTNTQTQNNLNDALGSLLSGDSVIVSNVVIPISGWN